MITNIVLRGFRGVRGELSLEFGSLTLLSGRNGLGKTTVFDALDWCLFGSAARLGGEVGQLKNLYECPTDPYVRIAGVLTDGEDVVLERTGDGLRWNGGPVSDREAASRLVVDPDVFQPFLREPGARVRQLVYLPQETLRDIVAEPDAEARSALLAAVAGVPHAAVVSASTRKVRERLAEREQLLSQRLSAARSEHVALSEKLEAFAARLDQEEGPVLARMSELLGVPPTEGQQPAEFLVLARRRLGAVQERIRSLKELRSFTWGMLDEVGRLREQQQQMQERAALLRAEVQKEKTSVSAGAHALALAQHQANKLRTTLEQCRATASRQEAAVRRLSKAAEFADRLLEARGQKERSASTLAAARAAHEVAREKREALAERLSTTEGALKQLAVARAQALEAEARLQSEAKALDELHESALRIDALREQQKVISARVDADTAAEREAETALAAARARASKVEELDAHVRRASELAQALGLDACPLCATTFGSAAALSKHLLSIERGDRSSVTGGLSAANLKAERLRQEASSARESLAACVRLLQEGEAIAGTVASRITSRPGSGSGSDSDRATEEDPALDIQIEARGREARELREKASIAQEEERAAAERWSLHAGELAAAETLVKELRAKLNEQEPLDTTRQNLAEATESLAAAQEEMARLGTGLSRVEEDVERMTGAQEALARRLSALESKHSESVVGEAAVAERLETIQREVGSRIESMRITARQPGFSTVISELDSGIEQEAARQAKLESEIPGIEGLVRLREQRERSFQAEKLEAEMRDLEDQLVVVKRASMRFGTIAGRLARRQMEEAKEATGRVEDAIQVCLSALTPHKHLDRVSVEAGGAVRVTDRMLGERGVEPGPYTSTGQQNVLALALFLGFALRGSVSRLGTVMLDEPVQNLDDLNLLALLGLLKRVVKDRQILLSTADRNVAALIARQLRSWSEGEFAHYVWDSYSPEVGPKVRRVSSSGISMVSAPGA